MLRSIHLGLAILIGATGPAFAAASSAPRAYVLDTEAQVVTALDIATGEVLGHAAVKAKHEGYAPTLELMNSDGTRLIVIDPGSSKMTFRFGFHPTEKSIATIIDTSTYQVVARVELGWNYGGCFLSPDGVRLAAVCAGYRSQKPEEALPREIVVVDLRTGAVMGRADLPRAVQAWAGSKDGRTIALFSERESEKKAAAVPAELRLYSLADAKLQGTVALDGAPEGPITSPDGQHLYLLDVGQPSNSPEKNVNGRIHVVSLERAAIETTLDVGSNPRGLIIDEEMVMVLSDGQPAKGVKNPEGELRIIKGAVITNTVKVGPSPEFLKMSPDRTRLYVVGGGYLAAVNLQPAPDLAWRMPLESPGGSVVSGGLIAAAVESHPLDELALSPDGKYGFALYQESSKVSVVNLDSPRVAASITTGRGGIKLAKFLGAMALTTASATAAYGQASNMAMNTGGYGYATYHVFSVAAAATSVAVRPDGQVAYVLNSQTNDLTIVDTEAAVAGDKIAVGGRKFPPRSGRRLHLLHDGKILAVVSNSSIHLIDTATQKPLPEIVFEKNIDDFVPTDDGRFAVAFGEKSLVLLDGSTGRVLARPAGFVKPSGVIISSPIEAAPVEIGTEPPASPQSQPAATNATAQQDSSS